MASQWYGKGKRQREKGQVSGLVPLLLCKWLMHASGERHRVIEYWTKRPRRGIVSSVVWGVLTRTNTDGG